jgi:hypothetical protein
MARLPQSTYHMIEVVLYFLLVGLLLGTLVVVLCLAPLFLLMTVGWLALLICMWPVLLPIFIAIRRTNLVRKTFDRAIENRRVRRAIIKMYNKSCGLLVPYQVTCQNSGYALLTRTGDSLGGYALEPSSPLTLNSRHSHHPGPKFSLADGSQFSIQLYHFAASTAVDLASLKGQNVLDIGCGRGGGLAFLSLF